MKAPVIRLNDGNSIPQFGLGLWQVTNESDFDKAVNTALEVGYRHYDTAQAYHNEQMLGKALKGAKLKREELYITTKIAVQNFGKEKSKRSFEQSLVKLQSDYVDLLLLHFPIPGLRQKSWQTLETIKRDGLAKSIGVSNYTIMHLKQLEKYADIIPAVNQVEMHLFLQQDELREYCQEKGIVVEAYSPLAHAKEMDNQLITDMAKKYNVSYAQIMLKWALQSGAVVIPKSAKPERIKQNFEVLKFTIEGKDMKKLKSLNKNLHTCWNPELIP